MNKFLIKQPRSSAGPSISSHVVPEVQSETIPLSPSNADCILGVGSLKQDPKERKLIFEYDSNIRDDAIFCLCCYLFKNEFESRGNAEKNHLHKMVLEVGTMVQKEFDCSWSLLRNGLPFCGHDESEDSEYKGLFLVLLEFHGVNCPNVKKDLLRQHQVDKMEELLKSGEILTGQGLNQILLLTNELNKALQKKDQDIFNAMGLLNLSKRKLQTMRESVLESLMDEVYSFCAKHDILIPNMTEYYPRSKHKKSEVSYLHHFREEVFYAVINLQLQELNNHFDVVTSDLLLGMASLDPSDSFANFNKSRIMKVAEYYTS
ncbi:uncharacterized protein LOC129898965 [Solanum dulcamara]|uniref:uncharacterized protein LOC129898965 n=1 Tax=Solanum dulcamara TaxID=45834 RepID=UPI002485D659|nr:uncharacterized protein LOC129898965 [Solanum dulcamara]